VRHIDLPTTTTPIRVLVVDDHPLMRAGLADTIGSELDMCIAGAAADGAQAVLEHARHSPDVTVMDITMPGMGGVEALEAIRRASPDARVIMLTTFHGDVLVQRALKAGAAGFLLKSSLRHDLVATIRAVHAGERCVAPDVAQDLALHVGDSALTEREIEVLRHAAAGNANKQIARLMAISEETVKTHMRSVLAKLGANDRTHAVTIALRRAIIAL
jgi:DNA-binding NarL/FixJ family response regulator